MSVTNLSTPEAMRYFDLSVSDQAKLLRGLAISMGRRQEIIEKDIWLCQVLDLLFTIPSRKPMAFKGGTSLSKVYQAIDRFSEDIDVTIDYQSLIPDAPNLGNLSNSQCRKLSDSHKARSDFQSAKSENGRNAARRLVFAEASKLEGPDITGIPFRESLKAFVTGNGSELSLLKAARMHDRAMARHAEVSKRRSIGRDRDFGSCGH